MPSRQARVHGLADYDEFAHLRQSLFLGDADLMAMLTVYGDASGSQPDRAIIVVAGFISTVEQWALFNEEWGSRVLAKGPIDVYHAADLEGGYDEFQGWKPKRRSRFQRLAYRVLSPFVMAGISSGLVKQDFETLKIRWHRIRQGKPANHYHFCVMDFIDNVNNWAEVHGYAANPINYVLERGDPGKGEVEKAFLELASDPVYDRRHLIGSVSFLPKRCKNDPEKHKRLRPLQAADIWAYETYKLMTEVVVPTNSGELQWRDTKVRPGFVALFKRPWLPYNRYWDKDNLPHFIEQIQERQQAESASSNNPDVTK